MTMPRFSVVVPTYNVECYLDEFLASLGGQAYPVGDIEIVFVDDGSTDSSVDMIAGWVNSVAPTATLLRKENGGLSSARNLGLEHVTGQWVTFPDPDDILPSGYFSGVAGFLADHNDEIDLVACRLLMLDDRTGELSDHHPLRFRFERRNRVVDLGRKPRYIHLSAASAFYRVDLIKERRLRFDERIRPTFEDGHFTGRYLASRADPRVAFLREPAYHYRRRADASSLVQASWNSPLKFTEVPRYGHLDLLRRTNADRGTVPLWLQNLVLYDLLYYFKFDARPHSTLASADPAVSAQFHETLPEILRYIDVEAIRTHDVTATPPDIGNALVIAARGGSVRPDVGHVGPIDADQRIVQVRYYYGGDLPHEEFRVGGLVTTPVYSKCRSLCFLGKRMASERIVWLPDSGSVQVVLDGRPLRLRRHLGPPAQLGWQRALRRRVGLVRRRLREFAGRVRATVVQIRAGAAVRRQYQDAWVFTDGNRLARNNAEHLYRFVKEHRPDINAWFVVDRDTKDWQRLEAEGCKLVQFGTSEHRLLMLNSVEMISSRVDDVVDLPIDGTMFGTPRRRFTFLQHDAITDDISRWVNDKPISRFITVSEKEFESIAGDHTPYVFTDKEVALTGLPRHDRLLRHASGARTDSERLLLLMPRGNCDLFVDVGPARLADRRLRDSTLNRWLDLLVTPRLGDLADRAGLRLVVVADRNAPVLADASTLPSTTDAFSLDAVDIQDLLVRGAALVTDHSPHAFDFALLNRPIIYFHADAYNSRCRGGHLHGTWSYERDGFGPVVQRQSEVLAELERLIEDQMIPRDPYATRMAQAFAFRDGKSCERVFESILSARRPAPTSPRPVASGQTHIR